MKVVDSHHLPGPLLRSIIEAASSYSSGGADITATSLMDSARIRLLRREHIGDIEVEAVDNVDSVDGTVMHAALAKHAQPGCWSEVRLFHHVEDWVISGQPDLYYPSRQAWAGYYLNFYNDDDDRKIPQPEEPYGTLIDFKWCSAWSIVFPKPAWEEQLNVYAWLLKKSCNEDVKHISVCARIKDWKMREAAKNQDYPQQRVVRLTYPVWDLDRTEKFIMDHINRHREAELQYAEDKVLPMCSNDDQWRKKVEVALFKGENQKATKLFASLEEAHEEIKWAIAAVDTQGKASTKAQLTIYAAVKGPHKLIQRKGEPTRCLSYCDYRAFCSQADDEAQDFGDEILEENSGTGAYLT